MATLVLSTVGSMLGGPVGGAIGSLVGQSIDQQIFAPASRGPRLGDLAVQSSSYGTQVPRIYGTMRVAGSVIWSTDLVESTQLSGVKGQPDETYSYSVSFAVALSSRPLRAIRRIWADGKLLRGEAGDFKVPTEFRFYDGTEAQSVDPLIASIEGVDATPAYRGLALAVFENLELAEFGNRLPFLTFEVAADEAISVGGILNDASQGAIACDDVTAIGGYAAMGSSIGGAVDPLVAGFGVDLADDGTVLRSPEGAVPIEIEGDDLGCSVDHKEVARTEREQLPARSLPASMLLSFYDAGRDYQTGQSRSEIVDQASAEEKIELPAVLTAGDARTLSEQVMARRWAHRDKLTLRLPPRFITLQPRTVIELPGSSIFWEVTSSTIDGLVVVVELRPQCRIQPAVAADGGRALPDFDAVMGEVVLALVELPDLMGRSNISPTLYLAASAATSNWKRLPVEISSDAFAFGSRTAGRKAVLGSASNALGDGSVDEIDIVGSVEVKLIDASQWLQSCDDGALAGGANLALLGDELIQFGDAEAIGLGQFRLTRLVRGRYATAAATSAHVGGDLFLLIDPATLQPIALPASARGSTVTATCRTSEGVSTASRSVDGRSLPRGLFVDGDQVVGSRGAGIPSPAGGATVDAEARDAVSQILGALRAHGLIDD